MTDRLPRGLLALTRAYLLDAFRSKTSLFWNFAFPLFFLFAFALGFADGDAEAVTHLMPGLFTLTIVAISFAGVSYRLIGDREHEVLRRYRTTPVRAGTVVAANAQAALVVLAVALALLAATALLA
ncbi:MAG: ABC transporter permease, partial [Gemmatimonadota bacterium]